MGWAKSAADPARGAASAATNGLTGTVTNGLEGDGTGRAAGKPALQPVGPQAIRQAEKPLSIALVGTGTALDRCIAWGAELALKELTANSQSRPPFRLETLESPSPWRSGASLISRLAFQEEVLVLLGPAQGAAAHLVAQIATRRRVAAVLFSAEESLTQAHDPWVFQAVPSDEEQAGALLDWARKTEHLEKALAIVPPGREGRERFSALGRACAKRGIPLAFFRQGAPGTKKGTVLLLWLDPGPALQFLRNLPQKQVPKLILGSHRLDHFPFLEGAPNRFSLLAMPRLGEAGGDFGERLGYDMISFLAPGLSKEEVGAEELRDFLSTRSAMQGKTGSFRFGPTGRRQGSMEIGLLDGGRLVPAGRRPGKRPGATTGGTASPHDIPEETP